MDYEVHGSLCIICCYAFPQNSGRISGDNEVTGQVQAIGKFIQQNGQVFNCKEVSLEPPTFLEEHLHLCLECTLALSSCTETGEQVDKMEMEVRRLQREILKMLRSLKGLITRHQEKMEVIESRIKCSEDGRLMAHKRMGKGRQKNGTWGKKNAFTFRNGILRVMEDLNEWRNTSVVFQLISEDPDKEVSVEPKRTKTRIMVQDLLEPKIEPTLEQGAIDPEAVADYQDYSSDATPAPEKDPLDFNDPNAQDNSPEATSEPEKDPLEFSDAQDYSPPESESDDSADEDYVLPGAAGSSKTSTLSPTRRRRRKSLPSTSLQSHQPKKPKYDHEINQQAPSNKPEQPSWYTIIHKKFPSGRTSSSRLLHCVCCPEFSTRDHCHLEQHLRAHELAYDTTTLKPVSCPFCPRSFYHPQYREFHVLCHEKVFLGRCDLCCQSYSPFLLKEHLEQEHGNEIEKIFECANCQHVSSTRLKYYSHLNKHIFENAIYACDLCPRTCPTLSLLQQHMIQQHPETIPATTQSKPKNKPRKSRGCTNPQPKPNNLKPKPPRPSWFVTIRTKPGKYGSTTTRIKCLSCPFVHSLWSNFEQHLRGHERNIQEKNLKCAQCPMTFGLPQMMELHQHQHAGLYKLKCDMCSHPQPIFFLKEHYQLDHKLEKVFECANCSAMQATRESYLWHLFLYHQVEKGTSLNKCDLCTEVYSDREELVQHLEGIHGLCLDSDRAKREEQKRVRTEAKKRYCESRNFLCPECGKVFTSPSALSEHVRLVHKPEERPYVCPKCGKGFKSSSNLGGHVQTCGSDTLHPCPICGNLFKGKRGLERHVKQHNGKGFTCEQCGLVVVDQKGLKIHLKIHEKEKGYLPCDKCDRTFPNKEKLEMHLSKQHRPGRREHRCEVCNKVFHTFHYLKIHRNAVHEKKRNIVCDICSYDTTQPSALFEHMKLKHPVEYELRRKRKPKAGPVVTTSGDGGGNELQDVKEHVNI